MRKILFIILPVVVLAVGTTGGWYWWNVLRFLQSTDDAYVQSDVSLISPKVEGYIKKVKVADNQEVAEGAEASGIASGVLDAEPAESSVNLGTPEAEGLVSSAVDLAGPASGGSGKKADSSPVLDEASVEELLMGPEDAAAAPPSSRIEASELVEGFAVNAFALAARARIELTILAREELGVVVQRSLGPW